MKAWVQAAIQGIDARYQALAPNLRQAGWTSLATAHRHAVSHFLRSCPRGEPDGSSWASPLSAEEGADLGRPWDHCRTEFGVWQGLAKDRVLPILYDWLSDGGLKSRGILHTSDEANAPRPAIEIGPDWWLPAKDIRDSRFVRHETRPCIFIDWEASELALFVVDHADDAGIATRVSPFEIRGGVWRAIAAVSNVQVCTATLLERLPLAPGQSLEPPPKKFETRGAKKKHDDELFRMFALKRLLTDKAVKKDALYRYVTEQVQALPGVYPPEETTVRAAIAPALDPRKLEDFVRNRPSQLARQLAQKPAGKRTNLRGK